jgi:cystathionine beta-synthase
VVCLLGILQELFLQAIKQYADEGEFDVNSTACCYSPIGSRYMSKVFSDEWMHEQGFFDSVNEEEVQKNRNDKMLER